MFAYSRRRYVGAPFKPCSVQLSKQKTKNKTLTHARPFAWHHAVWPPHLSRPRRIFRFKISSFLALRPSTPFRTRSTCPLVATRQRHTRMSRDVPHIVPCDPSREPLTARALHRPPANAPHSPPPPSEPLEMPFVSFCRRRLHFLCAVTIAHFRVCRSTTSSSPRFAHLFTSAPRSRFACLGVQPLALLHTVLVGCERAAESALLAVCPPFCCTPHTHTSCTSYLVGEPKLRTST